MTGPIGHNLTSEASAERRLQGRPDPGRKSRLQRTPTGQSLQAVPLNIELRCALQAQERFLLPQVMELERLASFAGASGVVFPARWRGAGWWLMNNRSVWRSFSARLVLALGVVGTFLLGAAWLHQRLPYIRPGAEVIYETKLSAIRSGSLFQPDAGAKVLIFGNSKVLTGFQPELFDRLSGGTVSSYNLGLPGYEEFIENLRILCDRGEAPTHVLLISSWPNPQPKPSGTFFKPFPDEAALIDELLPFRQLPRNLFVFWLRSRITGGPSAFYARSRNEAHTMLARRGYYFIEQQSHFPGHRLPPAFRLQGDSTQRIFKREISTRASRFRVFNALVERHDMRVIFVPDYYREGSYGPAPARSMLEPTLAAFPRYVVRGPDYVLLPNRYFSDPGHLNPDGAAYYTKHLWELTEPVLTAQVAATTRAAAH